PAESSATTCCRLPGAQPRPPAPVEDRLWQRRRRRSRRKPAFRRRTSPCGEYRLRSRRYGSALGGDKGRLPAALPTAAPAGRDHAITGKRPQARLRVSADNADGGARVAEVLSLTADLVRHDL